MLKNAFLYVLLLHSLTNCRAALPEHLRADNAAEWNPFDCLTNSLDAAAEAEASLSLYCRGSRAIRNVIHNLSKSDKPIVIVRGLEIVPAKDNSGGWRSDVDNSTPAAFTETEDASFLGRFSAFLRTHELNVKFSDLLAEESAQYRAAMVAAAAVRDLERNDGVKMAVGSGAEESRKKDKGQQGIILTMALMFAKILAVMGLSGIGALAMKALGVGMAALLLAGIVGLKSLAQHGQEHSHSVQYVNSDGGHHHHVRRRRRSVVKRNDKQEFNPLPLVYWGWQRDVKKGAKLNVTGDVNEDGKVQTVI